MGRSKIHPSHRKYIAQNNLRKKHALQSKAKSICLAMIVKNESKNMPRLFESLKKIIDMICITDTGSTDNTIEVIEKWGKDNNIPTKVYQDPFVDFAHNRTRSVQFAKEAFPTADYFLLSDADFVWEIDVGQTFDKRLLTDHKYLVKQYNKALDYYNVRLLSSKVDWICRGRTHEFWTESKEQEFEGYVRTVKINTLVINDIEDGGCKEDKYTRDERLLKAGIEDPDEPEDLKIRYYFYLGQTLKDMGRFKESIKWYTERIKNKGWGEEVYYAKFQIGVCYEHMGWRYNNCVKVIANLEDDKELTDWEKELLETWNKDNLSPSELLELSTENFTNAIVNYLAAYHYRPIRAESLYYMTRLFRTLNMTEQCYEYAQIGVHIKYPEQESLFVERMPYYVGFYFEISVSAFFMAQQEEDPVIARNYMEEGQNACNIVLNSDQASDSMKEIVSRNTRFYL